jgi:hypothetical protein
LEASPKPARTVEICGLGKLPVDDNGYPLSSQVGARMVGLLIDITGVFAEAPSPDRALPALVDLAQSAHRGKQPPSADEACRQITSQGWTSLDPDNAAAWLQQADDARLAHDTESEKRKPWNATTGHYGPSPNH